MSAKPFLRSQLRLLCLCIGLGVLGLGAYAASKFTPGKPVVVITGIGILGFIICLLLLAFRLKRFWHIVAATGVSLVSVLGVTYILLFLFIFFFQDTVADRTGSFFQPKLIPSEAAKAIVSSDVQALDLTAPDGVHLRGWMVRNSSEAKTPLIIYFGGSGSESSEMIPYARTLAGWSVALVNYRGFGLSDGTPTHSTVLADSLFLYDLLTARSDIDAGHVVSMGYSLRTGVAVSLSSQRPVIGTILVSPYDHWSLIGVKRSPLFIPLSGVMKPFFNSIMMAPVIESPLLCLVGSNDTSVPPQLSTNLAGEWRGETKLIEYPREDHGLLFHDNNSWKDIENFLQAALLK
jgi:pimeloyl-ACP methyl ester carboxylesterase